MVGCVIEGSLGLVGADGWILRGLSFFLKLSWVWGWGCECLSNGVDSLGESKWVVDCGW